jgi:hypothetical protein
MRCKRKFGVKLMGRGFPALPLLVIVILLIHAAGREARGKTGIEKTITSRS